jgi:hypothetical protein
MTRSRRRRAPGRRASILTALLVGALVPVGCSAPTASKEAGFPTDAPVGSAPSTAATAIATARPVTTPPSQSDTAWGPIWDGIPDGFPVPDGAEAAEPIDGPASGAWAVPVTRSNAPQLAGFYRHGLDELGWDVSIDGPLDDGSYSVSASNGSGCDALATILPRGDESLVTVLFGAGCDFFD